MSENIPHICTKCGETLVVKEFDGKFNFDGSTDFSGLKCPKCEKPAEDGTNG